MTGILPAGLDLGTLISVGSYALFFVFILFGQRIQFYGLLGSIRGSLKRGDAVTLVGFGTFSVARRKPRTLRNPRTGQSVTVGGRVPRFKPSKELRQAVR